MSNVNGVDEIRVLVVDDHRIVLDGLCAMLDDAEGFRCIGTMENGKEALDRLKLTRADVVLMDIDMPVMDGIEATTRIKRTMPDVKVISLTHHNERAMVQRLMDCGSDGYLLKNIDRDGLLNAIRQVMTGEKYFSEEVTRKLAEREVVTAASGPLSSSPNARTRFCASSAKVSAANRSVTNSSSAPARSIPTAPT